MELKADAYRLAFEAYRNAVALNTRNTDALAGLSQSAAPARKADEELTWLESLEAADERERPRPPRAVEAARRRRGDFDGAVDRATEALQIAPDDPHAGEQLASVFADAGDGDRLAALADALVARFPAREDPHYYRAAARFLRGQTQEALDEVRQVVTAHPEHARAQNLLGAACATLGQRDCAESAFKASIRANPRYPSTYVNLGTFYLQTGSPAAIDSFAEALTLDPTSAAARAGLTQARDTAKP